MPNINSDGGDLDVFLTPFRTYTALLNQSGTDNIIPIVFENADLGAWVRDNIGQYRFVFNTPVPKAKFWMDKATFWQGTGTIAIPITDEATIIAHIIIYGYYEGQNDTDIVAIYIDCKSADFSTLLELGDVVSDFPFEFRVYS